MSMIDAAFAAIGRAMVPDLFSDEPARNERAKQWLRATWDAFYLMAWALAAALWLTWAWA